MNRQLLSSLSVLSVLAAAMSPALALSERHQDEFINGLGNKLSERTSEEFYEGLGNKLSERHQDEFINGLGNKLTERFEDASRRNLDR